MAVRIIKKPTDYLSETAYVYDVAKTSQYFDKSVYDALASTGNRDEIEQYLYGIAGAKDKQTDIFNPNDYSYLETAEDKANYVLWSLYGDKTETAKDDQTGETYNVWERQKEYFDSKIQEGINTEYFNNLTGLEKVTNTIGGVVGNALNSVYGMIENIVDLGTLVVGGIGTGFGAWDEGWKGVKDAAAYDLTRTRQIQNVLNEYNNKNTYIGKNKIADYVNDVATGLAQYAVNFIPVVGQAIYWTSMYGGAVSEALEANPDIDFFSLMSYGGAVTASEFAIEKISGVFLGGSGTTLDKLTTGSSNKALTKFGTFAAKSGLNRVVSEFATEALEESIGEFWGVILWNNMVAQNDESLLKTVDVKDIVYAGLVGGAIGGLMSGGRIATQQNLVQLKDGRVVTRKYAKDNNLEISKKFTKAQSLSINEQLQQLQQSTQTSRIADLRTKYSNLTDAQIQESHETEWKDAVEYDELVAKDMIAALDILAKVHGLLGDAHFKKITDIVNETYEHTQALTDAYLKNITGESKETQYVTNKLRSIYGEGVSAVVNQNVSPSMKRLIQNLYNSYGVKAYSVNIGELPGQQGKLSMVISENTILIDPKIFGEMSEQEIITKIVRHELAHTLQFDGDIINPQTLVAVQKAMSQNTDVTPVELTAAYAQESTLTKLTEAQAMALANSLLFDNVTVAKLFYTEYNTLTKVYKKLKRIRKEKEESGKLRKIKDKMSYHELLKIMRAYREVAALKIGTEQNLTELDSEWALSDSEFKTLKDAYLPNENVAPIKKGEFLQTAAFAEDTKLPKEVVDILYNEDGTPKTFYKGGNTPNIKVFDSSKGDKKRITDSNWFTDNLEVAKSYANERRETPTIYSVELSKITNPKIIDAKGLEWNQAFDGKTTDQIVEEAIAENKGYDAVIIKNVIDPGPYSTSRELLKPATDIAVIDTSKVTILNESPRNKVVTMPTKAVHYGNFSKGIIDAEKVSSWTSSRSTGAYGTGTYLFSTEAITTPEAGSYPRDPKRTRYDIDVSDYNLFQPMNKKQALQLHEALLNINNYVLYNDSYNQEVEKETNPDIGEVVNELSEILNVSSDKIYDVVLKIVDTNYKTMDSYSGTSDTPATLLMKELGYDGVDVRGIIGVDNSQYGSVIYDLQQKDVISNRVNLSKKDGSEITVDLETAVQKVEQKFEKKAERKRRIKKTSEGVQLDVFEYIDEEVPVGERESTRLKAIEQEIPYNELKPTQKTIDKANKIKELCSELAQSEYQGDIENHKFAKLTNEIFEKGADLFGELTPDEWQTIRGILFMDLADPRASAALNAITRYAYLHRANQFASIPHLVKTLYANAISSAGQLIGLSSHDYNNHSVQSFITELAMKHRVSEIPLDEKLILKTAPEFKTVDDFKKSLQDTINTLKQKAKNSKDAYTKWELNRQASSKERILTALNDGDVAVAIDEQLSNILESNENISENLQKQNETYKALIEWLLEHSEFENQSLKGFSDKKIPLSKNLDKAKKFFEGLESFRYMMMLSNPATAAKNAISNTLILGQSYIEDFGTKFFEKRNWLTEAQQASYTGEYNQDFSKWVDDNYLDKIKSDAEGDKYTSNELRRLQQQYAEAKDPIKKNKVLSTIQSLERRLLNDKFWVTRRTIQNLKNTLAGSSDLILSQARSWLVAKYKGNLDSKNITNEQLIDNINKTNKELGGLFTAAINGDKVSIMKLAVKLNLDIVSPDLKQQSSIYYHSFYRANKMFFKVDNWFTRVMSNLNKSHPAMAYVVRHFIPFVRVTANATSYVIDRSPIGLLKGIYQAIQTKAKWQYQMKSNIDQYYRQQYSKIMSQNNIDFKFNQAEYNEWFDNTVDEKTKLAMSGDKKALLEVFNSMVENGLVNSGSIGSDNLYARAEVMEKLSQGAVGTALMTLGLLLGALTDAFEYDDDDEYLGPVVKIGDIKIGLGELSPFSTLFTMSAMLTSDKVDNKIEAAFNIFADATILSTLDSALSYSNGVWDYTKNQSINIISQYQPAITKALSKLIHNNKKDKSGSWGTKLLKTLGANSLIFNYLVPNKINPYTGKPEKYYDTGWFEGLFDISLPVGVRVDGRSDLEKEADSVGANTTGLSGKFTINNNDIILTGKTKEKYAKYKANYINNRFSKIHEGSEKVVIKDDKTGKFKTTTYDKLSKDEKRRVLNNLYANATEITKIQYWLDKGNSYIVTDKDQYYEYKKLFGSSAKIVYKKSWSTSKFVEG